MNDNRPNAQPIAPEARGKARQFLAAIQKADDETTDLLAATFSTLKRRGKSHRATPMMRIQLEGLWHKFPAFGSAHRSFVHSRGEICAVELRWSTGSLRLPDTDWGPRTKEEGLYLTSIVMALQDSGIVVCSVCERMASTRDRRATTYRSLCMCGIRIDGRIGRYRCAINQAPRPGDDSRIVATLDGRRCYPLSERRGHHAEDDEARTQPIAGFGRSRNHASGFLSKPRLVPPISRDLPRSGSKAVEWWLRSRDSRIARAICYDRGIHRLCPTSTSCRPN